MEADLAALECVCKQMYLATYSSQIIAKTKREKTRLASSNYRLRKKIEKLENEIDALRVKNDNMFMSHQRLFVAYCSSMRVHSRLN